MIKKQRQIAEKIISEKFIDNIRNETREPHASIEATPALKDIFSQSYSIAEYKQLLIKFYGFYAAIEPILFSQIPQSHKAIFTGRRKLQLLMDDLNALGLCTTVIDSLPLCFSLPEMRSISQKIGVLYVLEGSTMGGTIIRRHLMKHFGESINGHLEFYTGYGDKTGRRWHDFKNFIEHHHFSKDNKVESINAAKKTFACLQSWLEQ